VIEAKAEWVGIKDWMRVWVYERQGDVTAVCKSLGGPDGGTWENVPIGERCPPTFEAPRAVVAALVAGLGDVLPADRAMAHHLRDTITVRDRLLALVERHP